MQSSYRRTFSIMDRVAQNVPVASTGPTKQHNRSYNKRQNHRSNRTKARIAQNLNTSVEGQVKWPSERHCVVNFIHSQNTTPFDVNVVTASHGTMRNHALQKLNNSFNVTKVEMGNSKEAELLWEEYTKNPLNGVHRVAPDYYYNLKKVSGAPSNCAMFTAYWAEADIKRGLESKELIKGQIRINPKHYQHAFVSDVDGSDILLDGFGARNRALNGDIVIVKINDPSKWVAGKSDGGNVEDLAESIDAVAISEKEHSSTTNTNDASAVGSQPGAEGTSSFARTRKTAIVVAIAETRHTRVATGYLRVNEIKPNATTVLFSPVASTFPRIRIPRQQVDRELIKQDISKVMFAARIVKWNCEEVLPLGELCEMIGEAGQIEPETKRILIDCEVDDAEFGPAVDECLPKTLPWSIPPEERERRRDFTCECIFSIDPPHARDLDDALHCKRLPDGNYEVGVHIADVSHFVKPGTELDRTAANRCTSVYLVQRVVPMLPRLLCEELCSLNPDTDRLAFSVVWKMTEKGKILEEWFGRSVIRSCAKFSYDHAQAFIDHKQPSEQCQFPPVTCGFTLDCAREKVLDLCKISQHLRSKRMDSGALKLDQVRLSYALDTNTGLPNGCFTYEYKKSNELIEEFMLLANMAVAHKLYKSMPTHAFLRSHPHPKEDMMDDVVHHCNAIGLPLDASSSGRLATSLQEATGSDELRQFRKQALFMLAIKPQQLATYLCAGTRSDPSMYHHYALNVPLYTHFTSPIRRYADVVVHRQLAAVLGDTSHVQLMGKSPDELEEQAKLCNHRKTNSKMAQELSVEFFFGLFVNNFGPLESKGMVMYVHDHSMDVLSMEYGVVKRVYLDPLPLLSYKLEETVATGKKLQVNVLKVKWPVKIDGSIKPVGNPAPKYEAAANGVEQTIKVFSVVDIVIATDDQPKKPKHAFKVSLAPPPEVQNCH